MVARLVLPAMSVFFLANIMEFNSARALGQNQSVPLEKRTTKEIRETLAAILKLKGKNEDENSQALAKLKAYRYLAGVPYKDVTLDKDMNKMCEAGAKLCAMLGRLDHTPKNPGLPAAEYKLAYSGTSHSNLAHGYKTLPQAVDGWMFDSEEHNRGTLGHRRWCLNPFMKRTGFGREDIFSAMYSFDRSRKAVPAFDFISYPVRGYMPLDYFQPHQAWNVTLNQMKYKTPGKDYKPQVFHADAKGAPKGEALALDFTKVDTAPYAIPNCIIFRPESLDLAPGDRYIVVLPGIYSLARKQSITVKYVIEFVD